MPLPSGAPQEAQFLGVAEEKPDCIRDGLLLVCVRVARARLEVAPFAGLLKPQALRQDTEDESGG